jgi:Heterokaryon incompatibility protein (HET)
MRLIHIETLELHEFYDYSISQYSILSHRWEGEEITFKDVKKSRNLDSQGWSKVKSFFQFVKDHPIDDPDYKRVDYVWIDTCCIDKRNSVELFEAINSMYQWYQDAMACYAYLNDGPAGNEAAVHQAMRKSEWFTRGWTLQELVGPGYIIFVDKDWTGTLGDGRTLADLLSEITGITSHLLSHVYSPGSRTGRRPNIGDFSIAQIISWASRRKCTRGEDVAYSLMGLFNVNMPLLYGEGEIEGLLETPARDIEDFR